MAPALVVVFVALAAPQQPAGPDAARLSALEATCLAGRVEKCLEAGRSRLRAGDRDGAAGLYAKACSGGLPEGCLGLATRYAGLAYEARAADDGSLAASHADKALGLLRQAAKARPNVLEIAECEAWLCRLKAGLAKTRGETASWNNRARDAESRAEALRIVLGGGYAPDVFWRPSSATPHP